MGETKQGQQPKRTTKNSSKVTSLEEQNRVLQEVLEASRKQGESKNPSGKEEENPPAPAESSTSGENQEGGGDRSSTRGEKRKTDTSEGTSSPAKKGRKDEGNKDNDSRKGRILEYPDYDNHPLIGDGRSVERNRSAHQQQAGNVGTSDDVTRHEVPAASRRQQQDHELSWEEEEEVHGEDQELSDYLEEDDYGDNGVWDNQSISSSTIFPSIKRQKTATRGGVPEVGNEASRTSSSRPPKPKQSLGDNRGPERSEQEDSNPVADLVRQRVGAEEAKDSVGPPVDQCIADLLRVFLKDPNAENVLKLLESYPRPENAEWLQAPLMGTQVAASIPRRSNNYDKRLRQSQLCLGGSMAALAAVLQDIMHRGKADPSLLPLARKVMDAMTLTGYVHSDFNAIRKGAIRQVINPQYAGVFTRRTSSTPEQLMGESSVPDQLKEQEELSKVRAKLQKPRRGNQDHKNESHRGRGRGSGSGGNRGGFQNRNPNNNQGSGFGRSQNFQQRGARGARPGYPQQRRVYGHQNQNNPDMSGGKDQRQM